MLVRHQKAGLQSKVFLAGIGKKSIQRMVILLKCKFFTVFKFQFRIMTSDSAYIRFFSLLFWIRLSIIELKFVGSAEPIEAEPSTKVRLPN